MYIKDFLSKKAIEPKLKARTKEEVLEELTSLLEKTGKLTDKKEFLKVIEEREELGSTGIGYNVAIPHARSSGIKSLVGAIGISKKGIDFDALDKEPVHLFVILGAPKDAAGNYLKALATVSRFLRHRKYHQSLLEAETLENILKIVEKEAI